MLLWELSFPPRLRFTAIHGTFQCFGGGYFIYKLSAVSVAGLWFLCLMWDLCGIDILILVVGFQWEALTLLLIGISVNQLHTTPEGTTVLGVPLQMVAYIYTLIFVSELFFKSWSRNVAGNLGFHWMFSISIGNLHQDRVRYIVMQLCAPTANLTQAERYLLTMHPLGASLCWTGLSELR